MKGIFALHFDAYVRFSEHHEERPEIYALHPDDHAEAVETFGLAPDVRGGGPLGERTRQCEARARPRAGRPTRTGDRLDASQVG